MKKTFYALFSFLFCALCVFSLAGCTQNRADVSKVFEKDAFRILRQADGSGKIAVSYIFPVNSEKFEERGLDEEQIKTYRLFLSTYVNALVEQNKERAADGAKVGNVAYFSDVDGIGFSIVFDNLEAQQKFFGGDTEDGDGEEQKIEKPVESGFFVRKTQIQTTFPISSAESAENLKQVNLLALSSWAKFLSIPNSFESIFDDSVFIYDYATNQTSLKSELVYDDQNFHHNVFVKTKSQIETDNKIVFFTSHPNVPVWYASAVVVTLATMVTAYFVMKKKCAGKFEIRTK